MTACFYTDTFLLPAGPLRPPAPAYPAGRPRDDWDREYLLDVAAAAECDSWDLVGDRDLVEAICRDYVQVSNQIGSETNVDLVRRKAELEVDISRGAHDATLRELEATQDAMREQATELQVVQLQLAQLRSLHRDVVAERDQLCRRPCLRACLLILEECGGGDEDTVVIDVPVGVGRGAARAARRRARPRARATPRRPGFERRFTVIRRLVRWWQWRRIRRVQRQHRADLRRALGRVS